MGLSKNYRGYVIEDINGQYYIHNAPNFTNGMPFSPGPHGGWTVATRQVDKLIEYMNRESERDRGKYRGPEESTQSYSSNSSRSYRTNDEIPYKERKEILDKVKEHYVEFSDEEFEDFYNRTKASVAKEFPEVVPWEELNVFQKTYRIIVGLVTLVFMVVVGGFLSYIGLGILLSFFH